MKSARISKSSPCPPSMQTQNDSLLRFATNDADEFVENMRRIAPGVGCSALSAHGMKSEICAARLPDLGIFASALEDFRVHSATRPFYAITIPLSGSSQFLVQGTLEDFSRTKMHLQRPDRPFDGRIAGHIFKSLQLCFDQAALDSIARRLTGQDHEDVSLMESLDMSRPGVQSFARHAAFIWSELLRGGAIQTSSLIAQESVQLLATLLVSAADTTTATSATPRQRSSSAGLRRAEEYLMANLTNAISIADVAEVAGMSARTLSREFRRHRGTTIKGFIKDRRLEAANRVLLTAEPGETNVTQVALDYGFEQLGRFSAEYKATFGELPSETLYR